MPQHITKATTKSSVSLNGIISEVISFTPNGGISLTSNKSINVNNSDVLSYFSLFVRDYTPNGDTSHGHYDTGDAEKLSVASADGTYGRYTIDMLTPKKDISSNFNDITHNIRLVDDNLKICPNNSEDGSWITTPDGSVYWNAFEPLYITVFQNEGYIDYTKWDSLGYVSRAWNKNMGVIDCYHNLVLDGILIFPYGPAIISMPPNVYMDEYGPYYRDAYDNDPNNTDHGGWNKERYYTKYGKILGSMTANTIGMVSMQGSSIIVDDGVLNPTEYYEEVTPTQSTQETGTPQGQETDSSAVSPEAGDAN